MVGWLLIAVAPLAVNHGFWGSLTSVTAAPRLQSTGSAVVCSAWNLPGSGIKALSPALIGEFFAPRHLCLSKLDYLLSNFIADRRGKELVAYFMIKLWKGNLTLVYEYTVL